MEHRFGWRGGEASQASQKEVVVTKCRIVKLVVKMLNDVLVAQYQHLSTDDVSRIFVILVGSLNSTSTILTTKSFCDYAKTIGCFRKFLDKEKSILKQPKSNLNQEKTQKHKHF